MSSPRKRFSSSWGGPSYPFRRSAAYRSVKRLGSSRSCEKRPEDRLRAARAPHDASTTCCAMRVKPSSLCARGCSDSSGRRAIVNQDARPNPIGWRGWRSSAQRLRLASTCPPVHSRVIAPRRARRSSKRTAIGATSYVPKESTSSVIDTGGSQETVVWRGALAYSLRKLLPYSRCLGSFSTR